MAEIAEDTGVRRYSRVGARRDFSAALKVDREEEGEGGGGRVFVRGGAVTHEYIVERCLGGLNAFPIAARVHPA